MHLLAAFFAKAKCRITGKTLIGRSYEPKTTCKLHLYLLLAGDVHGAYVPKRFPKAGESRKLRCMHFACIAYFFVALQRALPWWELQLPTSSGPQHQQHLFASKLSARKRTITNLRTGRPLIKFGPSNCFSLRRYKNCSKSLQTVTHQVELLTRCLLSGHFTVTFMSLPHISSTVVVLLQSATFLALLYRSEDSSRGQRTVTQWHGILP